MIFEILRRNDVSEPAISAENTQPRFRFFIIQIVFNTLIVALTIFDIARMPGNLSLLAHDDALRSWGYILGLAFMPWLCGLVISLQIRKRIKNGGGDEQFLRAIAASLQTLVLLVYALVYEFIIFAHDLAKH